MRLLLVDDEVIAASALQKTFDWAQWQIDEVLTAHSAGQARQVLAAQPVDILLCDIEMPQESGLDLVRWMQADYPQIVCILLTCHADFSYAAQAIRDGVSDYLLKPVDFEELGRALEKAVKTIQKRRQEEERRQIENHWNANKGLVEERFWHDLLTGAYGKNDYRYIERDAHLRAADFHPEVPYLPILLHTLPGSKQMGRNLFTYALGNMAAELVLGNRSRIPMVALTDDCFVLLLPGGRAAEVEAPCRELAQACMQHLHAPLYVFGGNPCAVEKLPTAVRSLYQEAAKRLPEAEPSLPEESAVQKVQKFIRAHLGDNLTRETLASAVFLNPDYLGRLFKRETGCSLNDYIVQERIEEAKRLLAQTPCSIGEIAIQIGYSNFSYFSKLFKNEVGCSPNEYRTRRAAAAF